MRKKWFFNKQITKDGKGSTCPKGFFTSNCGICLNAFVLYLCVSALFLYPSFLIASVAPTTSDNPTWLWIGTVIMALLMPLFLIALGALVAIVRLAIRDTRDHIKNRLAVYQHV
jgi:ABC-type polysaccharide/polyol phosphate export permease